MLRDSAKIQQYDIDYLNKKRRKKGLHLLEPFYTMEDVVESLKYFIGVGYDRSYQIMPGLRISFFDAGHILGSAIVVLEIEDEDSKKDVRLVFSGDLGRPNRAILRDPSFIEEADLLLVESTYGNRDHALAEAAEGKLKRVVNETCKRGGKLIVPSFAIGRTQELVYALHKMVRDRDISPNLPVYVDSPLAIDATGIYRLHPEAYNQSVFDFLAEDVHGDPFGFDMMRYTRSTLQSKELNFLREPAVIISASGMCEAGRILHHLKNNIEDPKNTILIVGWQAPNTLGRRIVEKQPKVKIFGEEYRLKAEVVTINGFSAHADRGELLNWTGHFSKRASQTYVVHGEEDASFALADGLRNQGYGNVNVPALGQRYEI